MPTIELWIKLSRHEDIFLHILFRSTIEIRKTETFVRWFEKLRDKQAKARILVRIDRAMLGNLGDVTPVGGGVSEMRIHYGSGYRLYFTQRGMQLIILLVGGDKSTQAKDIQLAIGLAEKLKENK